MRRSDGLVRSLGQVNFASLRKRRTQRICFDLRSLRRSLQRLYHTFLRFLFVGWLR
jgi:hypothetical protein